MNSYFKNLLKKLSGVGLEINYAMDSGVSFFGLNVSKSRAKFNDRSQPALLKGLQIKPTTVLDVGSGGGEHAAAFATSGASVTCVDFGTSIYAEKMQHCDGVSVEYADFLKWEPSIKYELVWGLVSFNRVVLH